MQEHIKYMDNLDKKYQKIIFSLNDINEMINLCEQLIETSHKHNIENTMDYLKQIQSEYEDEKNHIAVKKNEAFKLIQTKCNHNYVDDLIDIDPDRSKMIKYCISCGFTK